MRIANNSDILIMSKFRFCLYWVFLVARWVKNLLTMKKTQGMWFQSLGWENPLEKEMASLSSILAWEIPWTEGPGELQSRVLQRVRHD